MVALDFSVSSEPDSILLLRTLGTELIIILMVLLQYGIKLVNLYLDENANLSTESGSKHLGANGALGTGTGMHTSTSISKMPNSSLLSQSAFLSSKMTHTTTLKTQQKHT